jgi:hypothetical protein
VRKWIDVVALMEGSVNVDAARFKQRVFDLMTSHQHYEEFLTKDGAVSRDTDSTYRMAQDWHEYGELTSSDPDTDEFRAFLRRWIDGRYDTVAERLSNITLVKGKYPVLRAMILQSDWLQKLTPGATVSLGEYWTHDVEQMESEVWPQWSHGKQGATVHFYALVAPSGIDWEKTMMAQFDYLHGDEELELRLIPGSPLEVTDINVVSRGPDNIEDPNVHGVNFVA